MSYIVKSIVIVSALLLCPAVLMANDQDLQQSIRHELIDEGIRTVEVQASDGIVTLTGTVASAWERSQAEEIARDHDEVDSVSNELVVESDRSDQAIGEEVARRLRNYVHYTIFDDVNVRVLDGTVTLFGKVTWGYKASEMAKMAARVAGVQEVQNDIDVLPTSPNDEQIRRALASRIYDNSVFFNYSSQPVPPIHIIVENGRVTLTGVARNELEKRKAGQIARSTFGVFSVSNELRVDSQSSESE